MEVSGGDFFLPLFYPKSRHVKQKWGTLFLLEMGELLPR